MVNGTAPAWVERGGRLEPTDVALRDRGGAAPRDRAHPRARSAAASTRPSRCATRGCPTARASTSCCRRWRSTARRSPSAASAAAASRPDDLVAAGTLPAPLLDFLARAVRARCNVLVCGGTGSGKTTTLNALSSFIGARERVVTIEDAAELRLRQPHVVAPRGAAAERRGARRGDDPAARAQRAADAARPDRRRRGARRRGARHAHRAVDRPRRLAVRRCTPARPAEALRRLETLALMADVGLPHAAVREQVADALDLVVCQARGARRRAPGRRRGRGRARRGRRRRARALRAARRAAVLARAARRLARGAGSSPGGGGMSLAGGARASAAARRAACSARRGTRSPRVEGTRVGRRRSRVRSSRSGARAGRGARRRAPERRRLALLAAGCLLRGGLAGRRPARRAAGGARRAAGRARRCVRGAAPPLHASRCGAVPRRRARALADALGAGHSDPRRARRGGDRRCRGARRPRAAAPPRARWRSGRRPRRCSSGVRRRARSPAWDTIVAAVLLQRDAGGDLAGLLRELAASLEAAERIERDARAATAQARFTAWVVLALPAGAAVLAELARPGLPRAACVANPLSAWLAALALCSSSWRWRCVRRLARRRVAG